jgi:hypothetical protein
MLDIDPVRAIIAGAVILGGIAFLIWCIRRYRRFREYRRKGLVAALVDAAADLAEVLARGPGDIMPDDDQRAAVTDYE